MLRVFWDEIKELYVPKPFDANDDNYKVANMRADALVKFNSSVKLVNTEPPPDSWLYRTRAAEHYTLMSSFIAMMEYKMDVAHIVKMISEAMKEARYYGQAMRNHNTYSILNVEGKITVRDILRDIVESRHDHDKFRSAARNHLQDYLAVMTKLTKIEGYCNQNIYNHNDGFCICPECVKLKTMVTKIQEGLKELIAEMSGELPESMLLSSGYNIDKAEAGLYEDVKDRYRVFRSLSDYYTTMSSTQSGAQNENTVFIQNIPLALGDGKRPSELKFGVDQFPEWSDESRQQRLDEERERNKKSENEPSASSSTEPGKGTGKRRQPGPNRWENRNRDENFYNRWEDDDGDVQHHETPKPKARPKTGRPGDFEPVREEGPWIYGPLPRGVQLIQLKELKDYMDSLITVSYYQFEGTPAGMIMEGLRSTKISTWMQYLRRVTHYANLFFGTVTNTEILRMPKDDDEEWVRLYNFISEETSMKGNDSYLTTQAMTVRLGLCECHEVPSEVAHLVKRLTNTVGMETFEDPYDPDADKTLCGTIRAHQTVLVTDLLYHTKPRDTKAATTDMQTGLGTHRNYHKLKVFQMTHAQSEPEVLIRMLDQARDYTNERRLDPPSVHIWLAFTSLIKFSGNYSKGILVVEKDFENRLIKAITDIQGIIGTPIAVLILDNGKFHGADVKIWDLARRVANRLSNIGALVSTNPSFWRSCSAIVPGTMYPWIRGEKKDMIFTIMEKYLFRQKILIACGLNPEVTRSLNSEAFKTSSNGINFERLSRCTALPKTISESVNNRRAESQTTRDIGSTGCSDLFAGKAGWSDMRMGIVQPEPVYDNETFWMEFLPGLENMLCQSCEVDTRQIMLQNEGNKGMCLNCSTNSRLREHCGDVVPSKRQADEMMWMATLAARLQVMYEDSDTWKTLKPEHDMLEFLIHAAAHMRSSHDKLTAMKNDLLKQISHYGGIRLSSSLLQNMVKQGHCARVSCYRVIVHNNNGARYFYMAQYDGGNVAYHDYVKHTLASEDFEQIMGTTCPSAELAGDIMEFWLGLLFLGMIFPDILTGWGREAPALLRGLEESFILFIAASRGTRTINTKRSAVVTQNGWPQDYQKRTDTILRDNHIIDRIQDEQLTLIQEIPEDLDPAEEPEIFDDASNVQVFEIVEDGEPEVGYVTDVPAEDVAMDEDKKEIEEDEAEVDGPVCKKRRVAEAWKSFMDIATSANLCLKCGKVGHLVDDCSVEGGTDVKMIIANIEDILKQQKDPYKASSARVGASAKPKPTSSWKRQKMREAMKDERMFVPVPYHEPIEMSEVGNRREGGRLIFQDQQVDEKGPWTKRDLEYLINRASERSIDDTIPNISEIWDPNLKTDSVNEGHTGYKRVIVPIEGEEYDNMHDFELGIIPMQESRFAHSDWSEFKGPPREVTRTKLEFEVDRAGTLTLSTQFFSVGKAFFSRY